MVCCLHPPPGGSGERNRWETYATHRPDCRSGERLLNVARGAAAGASIGQPAFQLLSGRHARTTAVEAATLGFGFGVLVLFVLHHSLQRLLGPTELLADLVQLFLGHGAELPELALKIPPGLFTAAGRVQERQPGA